MAKKQSSTPPPAPPAVPKSAAPKPASVDKDLAKIKKEQSTAAKEAR